MNEKVKVPGFIDDWLNDSDWEDGNNITRNRLARINAITRFAVDKTTVFDDPEKIINWIRKHPFTAIRAVLDGYDIEESRYLVRTDPQRYLAVYWRGTEPVLYTTAVPYAVSNQPSKHYQFKFTKDEYVGWLDFDDEWKKFLPPFSENSFRFKRVEDDDDD